MSEVKKPVLLDANLAEETILHPSKGTLKLSMNGTSEATLTLEDKAETIQMHRWVKIWNQLGFVGCFRRTGRDKTIGTDNSYTLKHGIDILQDSVWDAEETYEGTKAQFLAAILNKQTQLIQGPGDNAPRKPWVMGTCEDTSDVEQDINYDNLLDLFEGLVEEGGDYYFTYNQSVWPWQVSLVAKPAEVESEFRLNRNMEKCKIKDSDAELCTRLILNVNQQEEDDDLSDLTGDGSTVTQNESVIRIYNNTTAQQYYGVIVKTADIDTTGDTFPNGPFPEADAWAQDFLDRRAEPLLQIEIDGQILKGITGDDWDESKIGTMCRVALPDYATAITERVVTVKYNDLYSKPDSVSVSMANALPTFTSSIKETQSTVSKLSSSSRSSARQAESFSQHFKITDNAGNVLKQAGLHLDANGMLVYADDNVNMVGSRFNVQADQIGMVVGTNQDGNYIKAGEIALSINAQTGESKVLLQADIIDIDGIVEDLAARAIGVREMTVEPYDGVSGGLYVNDCDIEVDNGDIDCSGSISGDALYGNTVDTTDAPNGTGLVMTDKLEVDGDEATWQSYPARNPSFSANRYFLYTSESSGRTATGTQYGRVCNGYTDTTIHYLGKAST